MNGELLTHDDVAEELRALAAAAAPTVRARPDLAQVVLDRSRAGSRRRRTRRAGIVVGSGLLIVAAAAATRPGSGTHFAVIEPSESMAPTVQMEEQVIFSKKLAPQRGDLVYFDVRIDGSDFKMTKRVVALGGDELSCPARDDGRCEALVVNGRPLPEPYLGGMSMDPFAPVRVPDASAFVLGDNRDRSNDSRHYGPIPLHDISGVGVRIANHGLSRPVPGAAARPEPAGSVDPADLPPPAATSSGH
jgi:signal peptidase I